MFTSQMFVGLYLQEPHTGLIDTLLLYLGTGRESLTVLWPCKAFDAVRYTRFLNDEGRKEILLGVVLTDFIVWSS